MRSIAASVVLLGFIATVPGCQYYSVTNPETGQRHITHNWACWQHNGNARFTDLKTGREVRMKSPRLEPINCDEATAEVAAATPPAPLR